MTKSNKITAAYIRHYRDNKQTTAYVEWADGARTEGRVSNKCACCGRTNTDPEGLGVHMRALFDRARREGHVIEWHNW